MRYFDAHCHIQFGQYDADREELVEEMRKHEVAGVVVGCDKKSSEEALALVKKYEHLYASVGEHPNRESDEWFNNDDYRVLAQHPKVVAIGECGLDYFRPKEVNDETKRKQKAILGEQINLAGELNKPLIIHSRPSKGTVDAYQDLISILQEAKQRFPNLRGDVHFFVGGIEEMRALVALGFTVSFTAVVTFARDYDTVIRAAPLESILSETDAPYVPPTNRPRGSRNDPLAVEDVAAKIAEIRAENPALVRTALVANARRLFAI